MKPILTPGTPPLREALYALAMAGSTPNARVLDEVVRKYPQFADELTDLAVELVLDSLRGIPAAVEEEVVDPGKVSPAVSRAMSRFHNRLYELRRATEATPTARVPASAPVVNPFEALSREEFRAFADRIGANTVLVHKLRDRQIEPETIPDSFMRRVSDELKIPVERLAAHFAVTGVSEGASRQFYKADDKPKHDQRQTFSDAVRNAGLTDEEQRHLLSL